METKIIAEKKNIAFGKFVRAILSIGIIRKFREHNESIQARNLVNKYPLQITDVNPKYFSDAEYVQLIEKTLEQTGTTTERNKLVLWLIQHRPALIDRVNPKYFSGEKHDNLVERALEQAEPNVRYRFVLDLVDKYPIKVLGVNSKYFSDKEYNRLVEHALEQTTDTLERNKLARRLAERYRKLVESDPFKIANVSPKYFSEEEYHCFVAQVLEQAEPSARYEFALGLVGKYPIKIIGINPKHFSDEEYDCLVEHALEQATTVWEKNGLVKKLVKLVEKYPFKIASINPKYFSDTEYDRIVERVLKAKDQEKTRDQRGLYDLAYGLVKKYPSKVTSINPKYFSYHDLNRLVSEALEQTDCAAEKERIALWILNSSQSNIMFDIRRRYFSDEEYSRLMWLVKLP
jgi:hypothetical protein